MFIYWPQISTHCTSLVILDCDSLYGQPKSWQTTRNYNLFVLGTRHGSLNLLRSSTHKFHWFAVSLIFTLDAPKCTTQSSYKPFQIKLSQSLTIWTKVPDSDPLPTQHKEVTFNVSNKKIFVYLAHCDLNKEDYEISGLLRILAIVIWKGLFVKAFSEIIRIFSIFHRDTMDLKCSILLRRNVPPTKTDHQNRSLHVLAKYSRSHLAYWNF